MLHTLGSKAAYVVHGADGLDELSTAGPNQVSYLRDGEVNNIVIDAQQFGLPRGHIDDFVGGTPEEYAVITRAILSGEDQGPRRDIVLLNAAASLTVEDGNIAEGLDIARDAIDSGKALATLDAWVAKTNSF